MAVFASVCTCGATACNMDTGATCFVYDCDASHGHVGCVDHACLCLPGYCTDVDGRCWPDTVGRDADTTESNYVEAPFPTEGSNIVGVFLLLLCLCGLFALFDRLVDCGAA
eukprot:CAMPEP_0194520508 /NCGR_PEP_ID=MMETSP0253-20130528/54517_1 /TAXON_ID=2966 /ORGANISM="Noctiluca scintillans" /LENGTH=110 /DNA_ID=CAMNT_0039364755 /DNA_START=510 /DNA_END=842 /DNA_ORIENTATION=+